MNFSKWSLKKVEFLLSHIEDFVEDDSASATLRKALAGFEVQSGLDRLALLHTPTPSDPELPVRVFEKIAPFYEAGLLLREVGDWFITDFFWRGQLFSLENEDRLPASKVMREISPLEVTAAAAPRVLEELGCGFLKVPPDSLAAFCSGRPITWRTFLFQTSPDLWSADHVASTLTLINRSFSL